MTAKPFTLTFSLDDVEPCWDQGHHAADFRDDSQRGRFEILGSDDSPEDLIADPAFNDGSMLWCNGYAEALILLKVHQAEGYTAHLLWDMAESDTNTGQPMGYVVLTARPL